MLNEIVASLVDDSLDWFFQRLHERYEEQRRQLAPDSRRSPLAIDHILNLKYPPDSAAKWVACYRGASKAAHHNKLLIVYLKLDMESFLGAGAPRTADTAKQVKELRSILQLLARIPLNHDFHTSILHLSEGLWAVDNGQPRRAVCCLSNPSVRLGDCIAARPSQLEEEEEEEEDGEEKAGDQLLRIITESLISNKQNSMALFMNRINRHETSAEQPSNQLTPFNKRYDRLYAYLLVSSGQLIEALKYVRSLHPATSMGNQENQDLNQHQASEAQREEYTDILHEFFDLCSQWNATKSLNCLNLTLEEEEVLNHHLVSESRPITPVSANSQTPRPTKSTTKSKPKPRNRSIQVVRRMPSFNDSPARNTRSARKKTVK